jgi:hypothetical protein
MEICVHCPWNVQEGLLLDVVVPWMDIATERGKVKDWFYIRESYGGDTFLRVRGNGAAQDQQEQLSQHIRGYFASAMPTTPERLLAYVPYNHEIDWLGGPQATPLVERLWADTTSLAIRTLRTTRGDRASRFAIVADTFMTNGWLLTQGLPGVLGELGYRGGFFSYRATVEGWLLLVNDPDNLRARYEDHYQRNAEHLRHRLQELIGQLEAMRSDGADGADTAQFPIEWVTRLQAYLPAFRDGFDSGRFYLTATPRNDETRRLQAEAPTGLYTRPDVPWLADAPKRPSAGIHLAIAENEYFQWFIRHDARFMTVRLAGGCFFWHLFRLGLTLTDRYLLAYMVARTFEDVFGVDPAEVIRTIAPEAAS